MQKTPWSLSLFALLLTVVSELPVGAQVLEGARVQAHPGDTVSFSLILRSERQAVSALQFELPFVGTYQVEASERGRPVCQVNPDIGKLASQFVFSPADCVPGTTCRAVRALLFDVVDQTPIADGAVVASCILRVDGGTIPGRYPIEITDFVASSPQGERLPSARTRAGELYVEPRELPSPSPIATATATPRSSLCVGDCDADGTVTIDELLLLVLDALDGEELRCPVGDRNEDVAITIDEIVLATARALEGCES